MGVSQELLSYNVIYVCHFTCSKRSGSWAGVSCGTFDFSFFEPWWLSFRKFCLIWFYSFAYLRFLSLVEIYDNFELIPPFLISPVKCSFPFGSFPSNGNFFVSKIRYFKAEIDLNRRRKRKREFYWIILKAFTTNKTNIYVFLFLFPWVLCKPTVIN